MIEKVISGAQTGADRGALDGAIELGIPHGGFVPRGRRAEDGRVPDRYRVEELMTSAYPPRTHRNVSSADATVVFTKGPPERGSQLTMEIAVSVGKPVLHVDLDGLVPFDQIVLAVRKFVEEQKVRVLNVAGNRESVAPGIQDTVRRIMVSALKRVEDGR